MLGFYKRVASTLPAMILFSVVSCWFCVEQSRIHHELLPRHKTLIPWTLRLVSDTDAGGASTINLIEAQQTIHYRYNIKGVINFPSVVAIVAFESPENTTNLVDLTRYSAISFKIICDAENTMTFHQHSFDEQVTDQKKFSTYRIATKDFSCGNEESLVEIDLNYLVVPVWWLKEHGLPVSDQHYTLDKTAALSFDNDDRSPYDKELKVQISALTLHGRSWRCVWIGSAMLVCAWIIYFYVMISLYVKSLTRSVRARVANNKPLIAYQQLTLEPHKNKEKNQLLQFMAKEFTNPDMSLDYVVTQLGLSRGKINNLLKEELGLTFITYLNKLRIAEAANILTHDKTVSVVDAAFAVGFNNLSYFYRLFKNEYACTPKRFRMIYKASQVEKHDV